VGAAVNAFGGATVRASTAAAPAFVAALRERRVQLGLTQDELAYRLGWGKSRLSEYEGAARAVHPRVLDAWAAALGMRIAAVPVEESS
jgi:transcriptional regulator with XRE-family HTH domain